MRNLEPIKKRVIRKGFPELRKHSIEINYTDIGSFMEIWWYGKNSFEIRTNEKIDEATPQAIEGCIAHELSHIIYDNRWTNLGNRIDAFLYSKFNFYRTMTERAVDRIAVERGYGSQLLEFVEWRTELANKDLWLAWTPDCGLSLEELRALVSSNNFSS